MWAVATSNKSTPQKYKSHFGEGCCERTLKAPETTKSIFSWFALIRLIECVKCLVHCDAIMFMAARTVTEAGVEHPVCFIIFLSKMRNLWNHYNLYILSWQTPKPLQNGEPVISDIWTCFLSKIRNLHLHILAHKKTVQKNGFGRPPGVLIMDRKFSGG